ncbi:MAG: hypothetical protein ACRC3H_27325 [Lachnospiraceae bacterium]
MYHLNSIAVRFWGLRVWWGLGGQRSPKRFLVSAVKHRMISSELPEVMGMSDRVLVMHDGVISGILDCSEATSERIMQYATMEVDDNEIKQK